MSGEVVAVQPQEGPSGGFRALMRNRNYALLWWGQLISEMGNRFHWVAVSLWVYAETRSASAVSLAIASTFVGSILVSLWAGPIVDRVNRRAILIACDLVRAGLVMAIPSLISINMWLVYADLALISVATAFFRPAMLAVIPQVIPRPQIMAANSFFTAMDTGTEIGGPFLAGLVAQVFGYAPLLYADGFTYLLSALFVTGMVIPALGTGKVGRLNLKTIWADAVEGLRYVRRDALQWALFRLLFPAVLVGGGLNALQTPLAKGAVRITDFEFGVFQSVWGVGFLVASLLLGWYGATQRRSLIMLVGFYLGFVSTALMGLSRTLEVLLLSGFLVGFANTMYYVGTATALMEYTPEGVLGRVWATRQIAIGLIRVLSPIIFGAFAEAVGVREAVLGMVLVGTLGTTLVVLRAPIIWQFDKGSLIVAPAMERVWEGITGLTLPGYEPSQQRRLSLIVLVIVVAMGFGLVIKAPTVALVSGLGIATLWIVGRTVKALGRRGVKSQDARPQ